MDSDAKYKSLRLNLLAGAAYLMVIVCMIVAIWMTDLNEYAKGILTFILGRYSGYVDNVYAFEFGTTRANKDKDATIANLTAPTPGTTTTTTEVKQ